MPPVREYANGMSSAFHVSWTSSASPSQKEVSAKESVSFGGIKKSEVATFTGNMTNSGDSCAKNLCASGSSNPWGGVYKNRQHFNEMHVF